jgi:fructose-1,6-bisphosphatase/inositol monophosphatase family enzyme
MTKITEKRIREIVREEIKKILAEQAIASLQFEKAIDKEAERLIREKLKK